MRPILSIGLIALLLSTAGCANPVTKVIDKLTDDEPATSQQTTESAPAPAQTQTQGQPTRSSSTPPPPHNRHSPQRLHPHAQQRSPHVEVTDRCWYTGNDRGVRAYEKPPPCMETAFL